MSDHATTLEILETLIRDESAEPSFLTFSVLQEITNNFSEDRKIGRGGFSTVYKATGVLGNRFVAVKKLTNRLDIDEQQYNKEVECLAQVKHKNIVRWLGYFSVTEHRLSTYEGRRVMADEPRRLICFEYIHGGSLLDNESINDASCGLPWNKRYQIIKGICAGLHYLHHKNIVHLDLKPGNILLDGNMVPKIADFGSARVFDENQTQVIIENFCGTRGYIAPEYFENKVMSLKSDIYSLGVVIMEILTGKRECATVDIVLESWRSTLESLSMDTPALMEIRVCYEISIDCMDSDPGKRPLTDDILAKLKLNGEKKTPDTFSKNSESYMFGAQTSHIHGGLLEVEPLKLQFRDQVINFIPCPLYLTNKKDYHVVFRLIPEDECKSCCLRHPLYGVVPPSSACRINLTVQDVNKASDTKEECLILQTSIMGTFVDFKELPECVFEMTLSALYVLKRRIRKIIVLKVAVVSKKSSDYVRVRHTVSRIKGVKSITFDYEKSLMMVRGNVDPVNVLVALRKKYHPAVIVSVDDEEDVQEENDQESNHDDGGDDEEDVQEENDQESDHDDGGDDEEDVQEENDQESNHDDDGHRGDVAGPSGNNRHSNYMADPRGKQPMHSSLYAGRVAKRKRFP